MKIYKNPQRTIVDSRGLDRDFHITFQLRESVGESTEWTTFSLKTFVKILALAPAVHNVETNVQTMFRNAVSFDRPIDSWLFPAVTSLSGKIRSTEHRRSTSLWQVGTCRT